MKNTIWVILAFVIGWAFGLSFSLTVRRIEGYSDESVIATVAAEKVDWKTALVPTATAHVCPPLPEPCPEIRYKALPDVTRTLNSLSLATYEYQLVDDKLGSYITSMEGEYDWNLIGILSLMRSANHYLLEAGDDVIGWFNLGELTCPE